MALKYTHWNNFLFYTCSTIWSWLVFLFVITGSTYYEVSDNLQIEWLISGVYGEAIYEFPRFFQLYGAGLHFMYDHFPNISWMPILLLLIIYVSGLSILWSSIKLTGTWDLRLRILIHILILAFLTEFIIYLDFTRAALLCATAGVVLFFSSAKDIVKALAFIFIIAAVALRFMALYYVVFISVIWLLYDFKFNRMLMYYVAVLLLSFLSFGIPSKRFKEYVQLNKAKTLVNDYQLAKSGFPDNCLGSWFLLDEEVNQNLKQSVKTTSLTERINTDKIEGAFLELKGQLHWVLVILMICFIIRRWSVFLIYILGFTGLVLFFKFTPGVWCVFSVFMLLLGIQSGKSKSIMMYNWKMLSALTVLFLIVCIKTNRRIAFTEDVNQRNQLLISGLKEFQNRNKVFLLNTENFKYYVNPFQLRNISLTNTWLLTGWPTLHPDYKAYLEKNLDPEKWESTAIIKSLDGSYIWSSNPEDLRSCLNSEFNLNLGFTKEKFSLTNGKELWFLKIHAN